MNHFYPFISWLGIVTAFLLIPTKAAAEERDPQLEKIFADWQERQHWFDTVEYQVSGKHVIPRGAYSQLRNAYLKRMKKNVVNSDFPQRDLQGSVNLKMILDFTRGRHQRTIHEPEFDITNGKLVPFAMKDTFNGDVMKCLISKEANPNDAGLGITQPELTVVSGDMRNGEIKSDYFPLFFAHGRIYTRKEPILPGVLRNKPDHEGFYVFGKTVHDGRPCLIVRTPIAKGILSTFDEYWIDPSRKSSIVRFISYANDDPTIDISIAYNNIRDGHWLPDKWNWTVYHGKRILYYREMLVEDIRCNPALTDTDFDLQAEPGMLVEKRTDHAPTDPTKPPKSELSVFRLQADGSAAQIPDPAGRRGDQYAGPTHRLHWIWVFWLVCVTGLLGVYLFIRSKGKKVMK